MSLSTDTTYRSMCPNLTLRFSFRFVGPIALAAQPEVSLRTSTQTSAFSSVLLFAFFFLDFEEEATLEAASDSKSDGEGETEDAEHDTPLPSSDFFFFESSTKCAKLHFFPSRQPSFFV